MDIIDCIGGWLNLPKEEVTKNSKAIDENITYYWNPARGGNCLVTDKDGNYLMAKGFVTTEQIVDEYRKGRRTGNLLTEDRFVALVREYVPSPVDRQEVVFGASFGKIKKAGTEEDEDNPEKVNAIKKLISDKMDRIIAVSKKPLITSKGGLQKTLNIRNDFEVYNVPGNTSDEESKALYDELRDEIDKIVNS